MLAPLSLVLLAALPSRAAVVRAPILPLNLAPAAPLAGTFAPTAFAATPFLAESLISPALTPAAAATAASPAPSDETRRPAEAAAQTAAAAFDGSTGPAPRLFSEVTRLSFPRGTVPDHKARLQESLSRRPTEWWRALYKRGLRLDGPTEPLLRVRTVQEFPARPGVPAYTRYVVDWTQGPSRRGALQVTLRAGRPDPDILGATAAPISKARWLTVRFKPGTAPAAVAAFIKKYELISVQNPHDLTYTFIATRRASAGALAARFNGRGPVLYAASALPEVPRAAHYRVVFRAANPAEIARVLRRYGLRVLETANGGLSYRVIPTKPVDAETLARRLSADKAVASASPPDATPIPDERRLVITLKNVSGAPDHAELDANAVRAFMRKRGLLVLDELGRRRYAAAVSAGRTAAAAAKALALDPAVESTALAGSVTDADVEKAAKSTIGFKSGSFSEVDYNIEHATMRLDLAARGATPRQLARYDELCAQASISGGRFDPWSGD